MEGFYSVLPVSSDPKYGLGAMPSDLETFQFHSLCQGFVTEQLLNLDNSQSLFLTSLDTGDLPVYDEALSRPSTTVTPQSECSTRPVLSARTVSPANEAISYSDKPEGHDIETMYHDTTRAIVSGRQPRAASTTWPPASSTHMSPNSNITTPARIVTSRPHSFSYQSPQIVQPGTSTPPLPSNFFPSPNLQPQHMMTQGPFASPNLQACKVPQGIDASVQNPSMQKNMFYGQPQSQTRSIRQETHQFQTSQNSAFQRHLQQQQQQQQLQLQQHTISFQQSESRRHPLQAQIQPQNHTAADLFSQNPNVSFTDSVYQPAISQSSLASTGETPSALPNTTGNSTTGYQCFSHGCGGRHFSNWGNLVRHHRERQLRSKAGAKPTCARCGKGFTRSSARDAHVAGLKCVLGRRRRGTTTANSTGSDTTNSHAGISSLGGVASATGTSSTISQSDTDGTSRIGYVQKREDDDHNHGSEGSQEDSGEDEDEEDAGLLGSNSVRDDEDRFLVDDAFGLEPDIVETRRAYLAPQQLHFEH